MLCSRALTTPERCRLWVKRSPNADGTFLAQHKRVSTLFVVGTALWKKRSVPLSHFLCRAPFSPKNIIPRYCLGDAPAWCGDHFFPAECVMYLFKPTFLKRDSGTSGIVRRPPGALSARWTLEAVKYRRGNPPARDVQVVKQVHTALAGFFYFKQETQCTRRESILLPAYRKTRDCNLSATNTTRSEEMFFFLQICLAACKPNDLVIRRKNPSPVTQWENLMDEPMDTLHLKAVKKVAFFANRKNCVGFSAKRTTTLCHMSHHGLFVYLFSPIGIAVFWVFLCKSINVCPPLLHKKEDKRNLLNR